MRTRETIRTLNRLIRVCRDGEDFCRVAGKRAACADLHALLRRRSGEWGRLGDELQALVLLLGGAPATEGTVAARTRQAWLVLRHALLGPADATVIAEWQCIQQRAQVRYAEAIDGYLPERIRRTLSLQADRIVNRTDRIPGPLGEYAVHSPGT
jgi:uncharacterized protein (TIGR02284 family)